MGTSEAASKGTTSAVKSEQRSRTMDNWGAASSHRPSKFKSATAVPAGCTLARAMKYKLQIKLTK